MSENFRSKTKSFIIDKKEAFKGLKKGHKIAIGIACGTVIVATVLSVAYGVQNKYDILFYDLNTEDSAKISKQLEEKGVTTQIKGGNIYVPKKQVDKLRLELAPEVENGSKGFELMDEGSSLGMTDDEFALKKKRMLNGEIEKTIKTFPQVEDVRVHITDGVKSAFSTEVKPGTSAVSILLKNGYTLDEEQVRSIVSLVSASCENVPKENVEVVDQDLNLLSKGLFDEDVNKLKSDKEKIATKRVAEKELNSDLEKSVLNILEPVFGVGKVKVTVNSDLLFDEEEINKLVVDPNKVITHEERTESTSNDKSTGNSPTDNNMNNTGVDGSSTDTSKSEIIDYAVGKEESKLVKATGSIKQLSAAIVIDGELNADAKKEVEDMVSSALTLNKERGDFIKVSAMKFNTVENNDFEAMEEARKQEEKERLMYASIAGGVLLLSAISFMLISSINKRKKDKLSEVVEEEPMIEGVADLEESEIGDTTEDSINYDVDDTEELMAEKIKEDEKHRESQFGVSAESRGLEVDAREYAKNNVDDVVEVIKLWLSE